MDPLPIDKIAKMIGKSVAEVEVCFGDENGESLWGKRPAFDIETIRKHAYLAEKMGRIVGENYVMEVSGIDINRLWLHGKNNDKIKKVLLKKSEEPWGEDDSYFGTRNALRQLDILRLAETGRIQSIVYSNVTPEELQKVAYDPRNIASVSWSDCNCNHEYCFSSKN